MNNNINNRPYVAPREPLPLLGNDALRSPIKAELEEVKHQLQNFRSINEHPSVELISMWHDKFIEVITTRDPNNYPDLKLVQNEFIEMLIGIVIPVELFADKPVHIIKFMSEKLRDPQSIFYSKPFADNANKVIGETKKIIEIHKDVPENLLKQLRESEAKRAKELEKETAEMNKMEQLREKFRKVKEKKAALDVKMNNIGREVLEKVEEVKEKAKAQDHEFNEKNAAILKKAEELQNAAEEIKNAMPLLKREVELTGQEVERLKVATVQLQKDVEQTKKDMEDRKGNWLTQVACIVASVVVSYILQQPVIICASGVSFGMK